MSMYNVDMKTRVESSDLPTTAGQPCCTLANFPSDAVHAEQIAEIFKALADPTRLQLLSHVAAQGCDDVCDCNLTEELGITQPTVSHHMRKLVDAGLVTRQQRGKWAHYSIVPEAFGQLRDVLDLS